MNLLRAFAYYIKKPELTIPVSLTLKQSVIFIVRCIPLYFALVLICVILFIPLAIFSVMPEFPKQELSDVKWIIVFGPFLEEFFFRFQLRNFFSNIFVTLALVFYVVAKSYLGVGISIVLGIIIIGLPYIPNFINRYQSSVNTFIHKYFVWHFYVTAFVFGFLHITNFENITSSVLLLSPVIVAYQVILGLFLGFVRVQYRWGIVYAILVHMLYNAIPIIIKLL